MSMRQRQVQGHQELLDDAARIKALIISSGSVEDRLRGLSAEEREQLCELLLKQRDR